jgi:hypothetical protein
MNVALTISLPKVDEMKTLPLMCNISNFESISNSASLKKRSRAFN